MKKRNDNNFDWLIGLAIFIGLGVLFNLLLRAAIY